MKISAIGGLISAFFLGIVFVIALTNAHHYWRELKQPRLGQSKKRRLRKFMRRWIVVSVISAILGIAGATCYYFGPTAILMQSEAQYVTVIEAQLDPLVAGESPVIQLQVQNGHGFTAVAFNGITVTYTELMPGKLTCDSGINDVFKMSPHQKQTRRWELTRFVPTQEQINKLTAKSPTAGLLIFANGEWIDEGGIHHNDLQVCFEFSTNFPNRVALCRPGIIIQ